MYLYGCHASHQLAHLELRLSASLHSSRSFTGHLLLIQTWLLTGKMLPKEQAESSSDVKAATATSVTIDQEASDAEEAAARRVADTIIAAASQSSREEEEEEEGQNAGKAPETGGAASVSSTGEAEVVAKPGADAVPELAISQAAKEAEPAGECACHQTS